jgi:GT2 family glycosyltransferase
MITDSTLSTIILNYKNPVLTSKCVDYLIESANKTDINIQIIVVDNSAFETVDELKRLLPPGVEIIENIENHGFARANNQGILISNGEYILLLNNDVFVNSECLSHGINFLDENDDTGIWAPKLVGEDGSFQVSCARLPSIKGLIGEYILSKNYDWYPDLKKWNEPHSVGNVVGAFVLMKKDVIDQVGLLDEDYFFTVEDVDYCKRVNLEGFSVIYDPRCSVIHIGGASHDNTWLDDTNMHKLRILYFRKNHGILKAFLAFFIINVGLNVRKIIRRL